MIDTQRGARGDEGGAATGTKEGGGGGSGGVGSSRTHSQHLTVKGHVMSHGPQPVA
jgi:hypothetical protein